MPNTMLGTAASSSMQVAIGAAQPQRAGLGQEYGDAESQRHRQISMAISEVITVPYRAASAPN